MESVVQVMTDLAEEVMTLIQKSLNLLHFDSLFQTSFAASLDQQNNQSLPPRAQAIWRAL